MLRRQLPVHSPITLRALVSGAAALLAVDHEALIERMRSRILARYGATDALLTDSGTTALRLALTASATAPERPAAIPAYACYDVATASEGAGAPVVLYDVDARTLGPDLASLDDLSSLKPGAIVVAHLFGHLADVDAVQAMFGDALIIEDAAQGAGGEHDQRPLGSLGSLSIVSFGRGKGITGGGGGALLAHDDRGRDALEQIRRDSPLGKAPRGAAQLGSLVAQMLLGTPALFALPAALPFLHIGETRYHPPFSSRGPAPVSLAVLERVFPHADAEVPVRRQNANRLHQVVSASGSFRSATPLPGGQPGYLRLPLVMEGPGAAGNRHLTGVARRLGIARGYPSTLGDLPSLSPFIVGPKRPRPGAEELAAHLITLPTHSLLTEDDLVRLEEWLDAWP